MRCVNLQGTTILTTSIAIITIFLILNIMILFFLQDGLSCLKVIVLLFRR